MEISDMSAEFVELLIKAMICLEKWEYVGIQDMTNPTGIKFTIKNKHACMEQ